MATLLIKSLIAFGGIGALTSVGVGSYFLTLKNSTEKEISEWLKTDHKKLLDDGENDNWNSNWKNFKSGKKKEVALEKPWNLDNWSSVFDQTDAPSSFKEKCKSNSKAKIKNKTVQLYIDLVKFCTKQ